MSEDKSKESFANELTSYLNMRIDAFKLSMVENLSILVSDGFGILIFILLLSVAVLSFIAAFTVWLAEVIGSPVIALLIVGGAFLIVSIVVFMLRSRLIVNSMVRMFSRMFFEKRDDDENAAL